MFVSSYKNRNRLKTLRHSLLALFTSASIASAMSVNVDGILSDGEYLNVGPGITNGTLPVTWYNDHHSDNDFPGTAGVLHWEITNTVLNVFFEVPGAYRRMIWQGADKDDPNRCEQPTGNYTTVDSSCAALSTALQDEHGLSALEVAQALGAYADNHHGDNSRLDYKTQTESELFQLQSLAQIQAYEDCLDKESDPKKCKSEREDGLFMAHWDGNETGQEGPNPNVDIYATSLDYLLDPDNNPDSDSVGLCTKSFCDAWDVTASIEVQWTFGTNQDAVAFKNSISHMRLHLSDEAGHDGPKLPVLNNTPLPPVPVPASLPLLLAGIGGLGILARRKRKSA